MRSRFAVLGHPMHPMLVGLPIGLVAWTLVADVVYLLRDHDQMWYNIAFWTGFAAWTSAFVAALPGIGDFFTMARKTQSAGMAAAHGALNTAILAAYVIAWVAMLDNNATSGGSLTIVVALHSLGTGMLLLSGWLGGELVFRHHLAMIPENAQVEEAEHARHEMRGPISERKPEAR